MLQGKNYCITRKNLKAHELLGLEATVAESTDKSRVGMQGKIVNETKNTLVLETAHGERSLPKREVKLEIALGDEKASLDCSEIMQRPEDRVKYHAR
ncbi:MAG: ribonuclease P protein subunit [Candidatus Diapherotrites archaeon]|nr:ribonuclease P protein subunit [Candidatus Diapherotrites archaeon]